MLQLILAVESEMKKAKVPLAMKPKAPLTEDLSGHSFQRQQKFRITHVGATVIAMEKKPSRARCMCILAKTSIFWGLAFGSQKGRCSQTGDCASRRNRKNSSR